MAAATQFIEANLLRTELRLFWLVIALYGFSTISYLAHLFAPIISNAPVRTKASSPEEIAISKRARLSSRRFSNPHGELQANGALATKIFANCGLSFLFAAIAVHTFLMLLRTYEGGRLPFQTLYETLSWFAWVNALTYLVARRRFKEVHLAAIFINCLAIMAMLMALRSKSPAILSLAPSLQSRWYEVHVVIAFASYAVIVVSCAIEIAYLILMPQIRRDRALYYGLNLNNSEKFHETAHKLIALGFPMLTFGIVSGAAWANRAWGGYWQWDPKEVTALITWTIYAMYLHAHSLPSWSGTVASVLNIIGFASMLITFIGINFLVKLFGLYSIHAYI